MKTSKQIGLAVVVLLAILISTAGTPPTAKEKPAKAVKIEKLTPELQKQCGVTNQQIVTYLQNCSHHHCVTYVRDIPGGCNSEAGIENCGTATVYVSDGYIVGHSDQAGYCPGFADPGPGEEK